MTERRHSDWLSARCRQPPGRVALYGLVLLVTLCVWMGRAIGAPGDGVDGAALVVQANEALQVGDAALAKSLLDRALASGLAPRDMIEAQRSLGIAEFLAGDRGAAESAFLRFLEADLDGRLDPALVPPEVILFFEDVRSRHGAALRLLRPKPEPKRYLLLNFVPPLGQWQNGDRTKALLVGATGILMLGSSVSTYLVLRGWCDNADRTCTSGGEDRTDAARTLQAVNLLSAAALVGIYVYGVVDGWRGYRRQRRSPQPVGRTAPGGGVIGVAWQF